MALLALLKPSLLYAMSSRILCTCFCNVHGKNVDYPLSLRLIRVSIRRFVRSAAILMARYLTTFSWFIYFFLGQSSVLWSKNYYHPYLNLPTRKSHFASEKWYRYHGKSDTIYDEKVFRQEMSWHPTDPGRRRRGATRWQNIQEGKPNSWLIFNF